jgi:hypothetical protein
MQNLTESELAEVPSCNLAETKHNAWLQESGNRGNDLYVASVDDFIRALIQVSRYYQFLKGEYAGTGPNPGKEELMLWVAQHSALWSGNPKALNIAMAKMPGAEEFCTRESHFEDEEVFGSQKRKADIFLGSEHKSHRLDRVNYSPSRVMTRSTAATGPSCSFSDIPEEPSTNLQEHPIPNVNSRTTHVTAIHETTCKETQWHIARLPKTSAKACFVQQAITKKNCKAKIMQGNMATAAPTYTGVMEHHQKKTGKIMEFFFYNDDIERCVKGTKRRWVKSRPDVPNIWPVKIGTNISRKEILDLERVGFQLPQRTVISPKRLFGMEELPSDLSSYPIPVSSNEHPKVRSGKNIWRIKNAPTTKQANNCVSSLTLKGHHRKVTMIPHPRFGCIIFLDSGIPPKVQQYLITIGSIPDCSCEYFKDMATKSLEKRGGWASCKHLYFVFTVIGSLNSERDAFIYVPSFSFNEMKHILETGILAYCIP